MTDLELDDIMPDGEETISQASTELVAHPSADKLRIDYHVKKSKNYDSESIGASWEFTLPETYDLETEYAKAFDTLKQMVDTTVDEVMGGVEDEQPAPSAKTYSKPQAKPQPAARKPAKASTSSDIVENEAVYYEDCKVFKKNVGKTSTGKKRANIRVGSMDIPGRYVTAETFDPGIIKYIDDTVEVDDHVQIWGYFKPWSDNADRIERGEEPVYSLVIQDIKPTE